MSLFDRFKKPIDTKITEIPNTEQQPKGQVFQETSFAESPLYEPYNLRPYNPDDLYQKRGDYSIFDEMREDEQINATLTLKKFFIINGKWTIESEDEEVKAFLEMNLNYYLDEMFEKKLLNILSCLDYGFSLTEKVFTFKDIPEFGKKIILKTLKTRAPHTFEFHQNDKGDVETVIQDYKGQDLPLNPEKFIHYPYQKEFDNAYGKSELNRGVYRAWWSKNAIIKFWNMYLERFGMPTVIGKYPQNLESQKSNFLRSLKNLQAKSACTMPEDVTVEFLEAKGGQDSYEKAIDKYNTMIARKMLIPDLMGFSGSETGGGSFALGKEQFQLFYNNIEHETRNLERLVNKEIIKPLTMWNFGSNYSAEFKFVKTDTTQKEKDLKLWLEAVKTGKVPVNYSQVTWFLNNVNAPEIEESEYEEIEAKKEEQRQSIVDGQNANNEDDKKDDDKKEDDKQPEKKKEPEVAKEDKNTKEYKKYSRELTQYEKKVDFAKIESDMDSLQDEYTVKLSDVYSRMINALVSDIKRRNIITKGRIDLVNKLELKYRNDALKVIKDMLKDSYKDGTASTQKNFIIKETSGLDDQDVIDWFQENAIYVETVEAEQILKITKGTLMDAIKSGSGVRETIKMLDEALKGYDITLDANRLETIARTNISKAYNESRKQKFQTIDGIVAYQISAILDARTSEICLALDQKIFPPSELSYYNPPLHYNCRTIIVPIFDDENFEFSKMPATNMKAGGFLFVGAA